MQIAIDISLYPLDENYIPPIRKVIERLQQHEGVTAERNRMSTQFRGEFDVVIPALNAEIRKTFEEVPKAVFAVKILYNPIN